MMPEKIIASPDLIKEFQRIVRGYADEEEKIEFPTIFLLAIANVLDSVLKPRGRQRISGRAKVRENVVIAAARRRKAKLIADGMPKGKATDKAAEEAAAILRKTRLLSVTTIKRRMARRR